MVRHPYMLYEDHALTGFRIIVGVKYCFRYSQRNRRGAQFEEEVDLATLHPFVGLQHPVQRRRREKKLLKLEDVNERFPTMTYKAWRAHRERAGLSSVGGIAQGATSPFLNDSPPETPSASVAPELSPQRSSVIESKVSTSAEGKTSTEIRQTQADKIAETDNGGAISEKSPATVLTLSTDTEPLCMPSSSKHRDSSFTDAEDEDDHDHTPVPNELLAASGDNCAICIELLEDDDEVRGLTCGHCYHQTCIDPWLTQRRASCPLCKADYYIPKPSLTQTPSEATETTTVPTDSNANGATPANGEATTTNAEHWSPFLLRPFRPTPYATTNGAALRPSRFGRSRNRPRVPEEPNNSDGNDPNNTIPNQPTSIRFFPRLHVSNPFRHRTRGRGTPFAANADDPSALERGENSQS